MGIQAQSMFAWYSLCYDYSQNPNLYMEHGGQDDGYDYLQNRYLNFEHAG
jgi:hypothetical protein